MPDKLSARRRTAPRLKIRRPHFALLNSLGLLAGLLLIAWLVIPRVSALRPSPGAAQVPAYAPLTIEFNQPMDRSSVQENLRIDPPTAGEYSWHAATLTFRPLTAWPEAGQVSVALGGAARSLRQVPLLRERRWDFSIGSPRIAFLWPAGEAAQIYTRTPDGKHEEQLTAAPFGVDDFEFSADGAHLVYAALDDQGRSALFLRDLRTGLEQRIHTCEAEARCLAPTLSRGGDRLAFEQHRRPMGSGGSRGPAQVRIGVLLLQSGADPIALGPSDAVTSMPAWSPTGLLTYYDGLHAAIAVSSLTVDGEIASTSYLPTRLGNFSSWSPDGAMLVFAETAVEPQSGEAAENEEQEEHQDELITSATRLYRYTPATGEVVELSAADGGPAENSSPVFAPDGEQIAFARRGLDPARWSPGKQIWLLPLAGGAGRQLVDEPGYNHSALRWSPDSSSLVYMRFNMLELSGRAEIWVLDLQSGRSTMVVEGGYLPQWIP